MATYYARTTIKKGDSEQEYKLSMCLNGHKKVRTVSLISDSHAIARPYMFLDLLCQILPLWLYTKDIAVSFGYTKTEFYSYQPCLVLRSNSFGEKKYLLNNYVDESWLETVYTTSLNAMVLWWRENRDKSFKKPVQVWEIEQVV